MTLTVRRATIHDHGAINRIAAESAALHAEALPDRYRAVADALPEDRFRELIDSDGRAVFVAECDREIAGYATVQLHETRPHPVVRRRRFAVIDEIVVAAARRRQGIGRLLIDAVVRWAREKGASGIELNVYEFNEDAIAFYERVGFATFRRAMALPLGDAPEADTGER